MRDFSIYFQFSLNLKELASAENFATNFVIETLQNNWNYPLKGKGGHRSYLKRGTFGFLFDEEENLVFRRISNNKRKFAVVKIDTLLERDANRYMTRMLDQCKCPEHLGSVKVSWRGYKPDMVLFMKINSYIGI